MGPGSLSAYHLALLSHQVGLTGLSQGSSSAQSKGLTLHQHTHNTDTNTTQVGQVKLCIRSGPVPPFSCAHRLLHEVLLRHAELCHDCRSLVPEAGDALGARALSSARSLCHPLSCSDRVPAEFGGPTVWPLTGRWGEVHPRPLEVRCQGLHRPSQVI